MVQIALEDFLCIFDRKRAGLLWELSFFAE